MLAIELLQNAKSVVIIKICAKIKSGVAKCIIDTIKRHPGPITENPIKTKFPLRSN